MNASIKANVVRSTPRLQIQTFRDYQSVTPQEEAVCLLFEFTLTQEYVFQEKKQNSLQDYDRAILGFRFGDALDLIIKKAPPPLLVLALIFRMTPS